MRNSFSKNILNNQNQEIINSEGCECMSHLEKYKNMDFSEVKKDELFNISEFDYDISEPLETRLDKALSAVSNPYMVRVGDIGVKMNFTGDIDFSSQLVKSIIRRD